ncbi:MAG: alpha-galactosidase [Oscillospiraceae bacterium]|jgi:alpha-galactosidase|nr:alpha-galactosidase [Oscillospiraceae bacterium]
MAIIYHASTREFHLYNRRISYIMQVMENGQLGSLYFGKKLADRQGLRGLGGPPHGARPHAVFVREGSFLSLNHVPREYPSYGTGDFHDPAFVIEQENGSSVSNFTYVSHKIYAGKRELDGLPATYTESDTEADTLEVLLEDAVSGVRLILRYTIFSALPALARSAEFVNAGTCPVTLKRAMSMSVNLPDADFDMLYLCGAWGRERYPTVRRLAPGIQSIGSMRGISSAEYNPFLLFKRPGADEFAGEVYACSLIYSGNFLMQAEMDPFGLTRVLAGIHPNGFSWRLQPGERFQTPEAVLVYSREGLNGMSQAFHRLYGRRLARGPWRDRERPIVINNWESTGFAFDEKSILALAETARKLGVECFVLDDGWFGGRNSDRAGLGDWTANRKKLPDGIGGLSRKINAMGMKFGLWVEPEMVNPDSNLYRAHPDWILHVPERSISPSRHQYVLDFSRPEVVDAVYEMLHTLLKDADISYLKWDMNRYLTECYSVTKQPWEQGKVFHSYILGVYRLCKKLLADFPALLLESCASGGARFDPGMLAYAPQAWCSDDTDAVERLKIQYGTSLAYPVSSISAHVSAVPNQQVGRVTPLQTRAEVAMFGVFGYELDFNALTVEERQEIAGQISFVKEHRKLLEYGTFWRLLSPFGGGEAAWMTVSESGEEAIAAYYCILNRPNGEAKRLKLKGLNPDRSYIVDGDRGTVCPGDVLMEFGLPIRPEPSHDFSSRLFYLHAAADAGDDFKK